MARTKQTARESAGGKAPRKQLSGAISESMTITDHTGNKVILSSRSAGSGLGFFPFQVYILETAKTLTTDKEFPIKLRSYIASNNACIRFNENCRWRLEVFTCPQATILNCIYHHEREKAIRQSVGLGPILLNRKELIIVDTEDWETTGLLAVEYTAQLFNRDGSEREFENHVNDHPGWEDDEEELALPGLRKNLVVQRHPHVDQFAEHFLQKIWDDEGHEWALSSLMERNVALGWPDDAHLLESNTLPYKPVAKQITRGYLRHEKRPRLDDEDEDCEDEWFSHEEVEDIITYGEKCDSNTGMPKSILHWMRQPTPSSENSMHVPDLVDIEVREYIDGLRTRCVDCSHTAHASSTTHFSYNLYIIGYDRRKEPPQALFALLNQKILKRIPWKLHIYKVWDLSMAISHHTAEMARRPFSGRLPVGYAGFPEQPQSHIFLYIDERTPLDAGPKVVTQDATSTGMVLDVLHAGSWQNAAQMLFTYLILCDETPTIMKPSNTATPPSITAAISLTPHHPDSSPCCAPESLHLSLTFSLDPATSRGIIINTYNTILTSNPYLWDTFLCIIDSETGEEVPLPPPPAYLSQPQRTLGVEQLQHLSFPFSDSSPTRHRILRLSPGGTVTRTVIFNSSCLMHRYREVLVEGKCYKVKLKPGLTGGRWIWDDDEGDREGDTSLLGCGTVPGVEGGEVARFTFQGLGEGEKGYPEPNCHVEC